MSINGDELDNKVTILILDNTVQVECDDQVGLTYVNVHNVDVDLVAGNNQVHVFQDNQTDLAFLRSLAIRTGFEPDTANLQLSKVQELYVDLGSDPFDTASVRIGGLDGDDKGEVAIEQLTLVHEGLVLDKLASALEIDYARDRSGNRNVAVQIEDGSLNPGGGSITMELGDSAGRIFDPIVFRRRIDKSTPLLAIGTEWNPNPTQRLQQSTTVRQLNDGLIGVGDDLLIQTLNGSGDTFRFQSDLKFAPSEEVEVSVGAFDRSHRLFRSGYSFIPRDGDEGKVKIDATVADGSLTRLDVGAIGFDAATVAALATSAAAVDVMLAPAAGHEQGEQSVDVDLNLREGGDVNVNVRGSNPSEAQQFDGSIGVNVHASNGSLGADIEIARLWIPDPDDEVLVIFEHGDPDARITGRVELSDVTLAPRDAASGLPTGKRQHKPFTGKIHAPLIGAFDLMAGPMAGMTEPTPIFAEMLWDIHEKKGEATLEWMARRLDTSFTNLLPTIGDLNHPVITGRFDQAGKPLLILAEDIEGEAINIEWSKTHAPDGGAEIEPGGIEFPNVTFYIASDLPDRTVELESEHVPELGVLFTGPQQQELAVDASGLGKSRIEVETGNPVIGEAQAATVDLELLGAGVNAASVEVRGWDFNKKEPIVGELEATNQGPLSMSVEASAEHLNGNIMWLAPNTMTPLGTGRASIGDFFHSDAQASGADASFNLQYLPKQKELEVETRNVGAMGWMLHLPMGLPADNAPVILGQHRHGRDEGNATIRPLNDRVLVKWSESSEENSAAAVEVAVATNSSAGGFDLASLNVQRLQTSFSSPDVVAKSTQHTPFFKGYRPQFYFRTTDVNGRNRVDLEAVSESTELEMDLGGNETDVAVNVTKPVEPADSDPSRVSAQLNVAGHDNSLQFVATGTRRVDLDVITAPQVSLATAIEYGLSAADPLIEFAGLFFSGKLKVEGDVGSARTPGSSTIKWTSFWQTTFFQPDGTPLRATFSTSLKEPLSAAIAVAGLFEASHEGGLSSLALTDASSNLVEVSATSTVQRNDGSSTTASADVKGAIRGGRIGISRAPDMMAVEIDGAEISGEFYDALIVETTLPPLDGVATVDFIGELALSGVTFNNSVANVGIIGPVISVALEDPNVINGSNLDLTARLDGASAGGWGDVTLKRGTIASNSVLSLRGVGTPFDDRMTLAVYDSVVEEDAQLLVEVTSHAGDDKLLAGVFNTVVDGAFSFAAAAGDGADDIGLVFDFDDVSRGMISIHVDAGADYDRTALLVSGAKKAKLSALVDAGTGFDQTVVSPQNVPVENSGNRQPPHRSGGDRVREDEILAALRELFETPDELTYDVVQAAIERLYPGVYIEEIP